MAAEQVIKNGDGATYPDISPWVLDPTTQTRSYSAEFRGFLFALTGQRHDDEGFGAERRPQPNPPHLGSVGLELAGVSGPSA